MQSGYYPKLSIDLTGYCNNTTFTSFSTSTALYINNLNATSTTLFNKTNFSNLFITGASTLLSSFNISGQTNLNNVSIKGNWNVAGITTIIGTVINNTSFNSFSVSGPSIHYGNITCVSSLNVSGTTKLNGATTCMTSLM